MPTVDNSIIAYLVKSFYDYILSSGAKFKMGLNLYTDDLLAEVACESTATGVCVYADYSGEYIGGSTSTTGQGEMTATFTAKYTPSSDMTVNLLSLASMGTDIVWAYNVGFVELSGFSVSLTGGAEYTITVTNKITHPATI